MSVNEIIVYIMAAFAVLGALDRIFGSRLGLGTKFEEGISTMGGLVLAMVGIFCLAPVLGKFLQPIAVPVFEFLGADAAMFAGCFFANDGGAPALAEALATDPLAANFSGFIVGSMMGVTIIFTIPVSMSMTEKEDRNYAATGVLAGLITLPIGCLMGGLAAGYSIGMLIRNLIPIIILALLIAGGLWKFEKIIIKAFTWFGKIMMGIIIFGLGAGIVEGLTGIAVIPGMKPIEEGFAIVADVAMILAGAYPLMYVITKLLSKPLTALGKFVGINETSVAGMVATLLNSLPMFGMVKDMNARGKVINIAFAVSASFALGDHLGFTAGYRPEMLVPMIVGKLGGGITAVLLALQLTKNYEKQ